MNEENQITNITNSDSGSGSLVGSIIVVIILIIGAIYLFSSKVGTPATLETTDQTEMTQEQPGTGDATTELGAIEGEAEVLMDDVSSLDADINALNAELSQ